MRILIVLFLFIFTPLSYSQEKGAEQQKGLNIARIAADDFYQMVDNESRQRIEQLKVLINQKELNNLHKLQKITIDFIKKQNPLKHMRELFIEHGIGVAITSIVSEFVTILVMPPILITSGLPIAATFIATVPSPLYSVPIYLAIAKKHQKKKLIKALGLKNVRQLEDLRYSIFGHAREYHLLTITLSHLEENYDISIINRPYEKWRRKPLGHTISLNELEKIFLKYFSKKEIKIIQHLCSADKRLYSILLISRINELPAAEQQLINLVKTRYSFAHSTLNNESKKNLIKIDDKIKAIRKLIQTTRKEKLKALKKLKDHHVSEHQYLSTSNYYDNLISDMLSLELTLKKHEYSILARLLEGHPLDEDALRRSRKLVLTMFRELEKRRRKINVDDLIEQKHFPISLNQKLTIWERITKRSMLRIKLGDCWQNMKKILAP